MTTRLERLRERFASDPSDRATFEALEEHHFLSGDWQALVPIYEQHLAATEGARTPLEAARLLYRLGHALDEAGVDPGRAEQCHRRALEIDPRFAPALRRLRLRCTAEGRWSEALALAGREAETASRPTERAALLAEVGEGALRAGAHPVAIAAFEQALAADAGSRRAWLGSAESLEAAGRWEDAAGRWQQALDLAPLEPRERAIATRRLGRLWREALGEPTRALAVYEAAHRAAPDEPEWIEAMAAALQALGRAEDLAALAERRLALADDDGRRAAIARETGQALLARGGELAAARRWLERAVAWREDGESHLALAEAAGRAGDPQARTWHLERAMELGAEIPSWSDLGLGGEAPEAPSDALLDGLRRAVADAPSDPDALVALADALEAGHHDLERVELLERLAALARDPGERVEHLLRLGALHESLDDPAAAAGAYQMAFDAAPAHAGALAALDRTLRKLERSDALAEVHARAADAADPPRRAALLAVAGALRLERGDVAAAGAAFAAALAADPTCAAALEGAARVAAASGDDEGVLAALLAEAAQAPLERLEALVPDLERRLDALGRGEEALPALRRAAALSPAPRAALVRLAARLEDLGDTDELSLVLERLDALLDGPERGANQRRLAWLHAAEGRSDAAADAWRAALRHDPSDSASLEALLDALAGSDRPEDALALLEELGSPPGSRAVAAHRARALERCGRHAEAAAAWQALHEDGERSDDLLAAWERCARAAGDAASLAAVLGERAARSEDEETRARLELERARLLADELARPDEARRLLEALSDRALPAPLGDEIARRLEALLERSGDFAALCDRLEARAEQLPVEQAWRLHARVAELAETRLGDIPRARRHLELRVAAAPDDPGPWQRLGALYESSAWPSEWLRAVEGELAALERLGEGGEASRARRLALHVQAARVARDALCDPERAAVHWRRALALAPGHPEAGEALLARAEAAGAWEEVADLLQQRLERLGARADEAERAASLRLRLADLLATRLERRADAIAVLEAAPATGAGAAASAERLVLLYRETGRHDALAALSELQAQAASAASERARWQRRLGDALRARGDLAAAECAYEAALAVAPGDPEARAALAGLLRARGAHARLAELLEASLPVAGREAMALRAELAALLEGPLATPTRALDHWKQLAELDPSADLPRERAVAVAERLGRLDDALALLRAAALDPRTGAARARCWTRCAELLAGPLGRSADAVAAWREALLLDPDQPGARRALRVALEALDRPVEALAELRAEWGASRGDERIALAAHGADLAAARAPDALPAWLARLVADVPDDASLWEAIAGLHRRARRWEACAHALAEAARCAPTAAWRGVLHRERASLLERALRDPGRACAALEAARAEDPTQPDALAGLDRLYASANRPRERLEILEARIAAASAPALRAALAREAAPLASALFERDRAAQLWQEALAGLDGPARRAVLAPAAEALRAAGRDDAWAALAEEELATAAPAAERALALRRALARTWARLGLPDRALAHARAVVDAEAAEDADHRLLLSLLRAEGDRVELARRLAIWATRAPQDERTAAWAELARLREERLGLAAAAADAWREVLGADPDSREAWSGLRRCAERSGDAPELARVLEAELERGFGPAAERWRRLGRVRWKALGDAAGAVQALEAARAAEPDELTALRLLEEIAEATGASERAVALRLQEIELLGDADPPRRRSLWCAVARLAGRQAPDPALAARAWEQAHALGALDAPALADWARALAATGERERWIAVFGAWCDHADARPSARDLLALAEALAERDRPAAEARLAAALAGDPSLAAAWRLRARLREAEADAAGAAAAWLRAAEHERGAPAAEALTRGAEHLQPSDPARALAALERAAACAPDHAPAHAALARLAERQGRDELALAAATRLAAVDAPGPAVLSDADRLAALLAGARAARRLARWSSAWQLGGEALALAPGHPDALASRGLAAFHLGATGECQRDLAARLALPEPDPSRSELLVALARALEAGGDLAAALARHEEALLLVGNHEEAHAGRLRTLERLGRRGEAAAALAEWAAHTAEPALRAERYVRAARLARLAEAASDRVEGWLRAALAADPAHATAWYELATGLWEEQRVDEALAAATEGAGRVGSPSVRAVLETLRGRALERRGDARAALAAYREAVVSDAESREAALAAAHLLRRAGDWQEAAEILRRAAEGHGDPEQRSALCLELARLLAGPLEDVAGALDALDRARALAPARLDVREARAALLAHVPERAEEALAELAAVLEHAPLRADAIRRATRLLAERGDAAAAARGLALLHALGVASAHERAGAPSRIDLSCTAALPPLDETAEALRQTVSALAPLVAGAGGPADAGGTPEATTGSASPRAAWQAAARELLGAPDLLGLEVFRLRGALEAMLADARNGALGREGARALRRLDPRTLERVDLIAWRTALRARCWARAVDALGGDLGAVLSAIAREAGAPAEAEFDRTPWLGEAPEALALLRAVEQCWLAAVR